MDTVEDHGEPLNTEVVIIDGFFLLHQLKQVPEKFGDISLKILRTLAMKEAKRIYLIFHEYKSPSIKDNEHVFRDNFSRDYCITGPEQTRPSDFGAELKNLKFKDCFVSFLVEHWISTPLAVDIIRDKEIYVSYKKCYSYKADRGSVAYQIISNNKCEGHEEADTKIAFFLRQIEGSCDVVIQCSDTDILVILLGNMADMSQSLKVWLLFGTGNSQQFVNVTKVYASLGTTVCAALPAFHAFTGCDFNPSFYRLGKSKPWKTFKANEDYQKAFSCIQDPANENYASSCRVIEDFVCKMYATKKNGLKQCTTVNEARVNLFTCNYSMIDSTESFKKSLLNFDGCVLPPCNRELQQHILRTAYIGNMWSNAYLSNPSTLNPTEFGWMIEPNNTYTLRWFEGDEVPQFVHEVFIEPNDTEDHETDVQDDSEMIIASDDDDDDDGSNDDEDDEIVIDMDSDTREEEDDSDEEPNFEIEITE